MSMISAAANAVKQTVGMTSANVVKQSIAVIGSGAIGCYYGARLSEAGHDVTFIMRRDLQTVQSRGLIVRSPAGDIMLPPDKINVRASADGMQPVDWLLLGLKSYSMRNDARRLAASAYGPSTRVLAIGNGLVDDLLQDVFDNSNRIFGALAFVCVERDLIEKGLVHHKYAGRLLIGHHGNNPQELKEAKSLWEGTKVEVEMSPDLLTARYEKLLWNIPFSGSSCCLGGQTVDVIAKDPKLRALATRLMQETLAIGRADVASRRKYNINKLTQDNSTDNELTEHNVTELDEIIPTARLTAMWELTDGMGAYLPSASADLLANRPLELHHLFEEPLRRGIALGVSTPLLHAVKCMCIETQRMKEEGNLDVRMCEEKVRKLAESV